MRQGAPLLTPSPPPSHTTPSLQTLHTTRGAGADREILTRINTLLTYIQRNGNEGIGKPEALKHYVAATGRAASPRHRLVHKIVGDEIRITACYHYG